MQIFALISRADTQSGLQVAISANDLAKAAKEDSQSMKTIAVMTMAFLPATSVAAILAVPWERGDHTIRTLQAVLYCTVTIGVTTVIFLLWKTESKWFRSTDKTTYAGRLHSHTSASSLEEGASTYVGRS